MSIVSGGATDGPGALNAIGTGSGACVAVVDRVARTVLAAGNDFAASSTLGPLNGVPHIAHSLDLTVLFLITPLARFFPLPFLGLGLGLTGPVASTTCLNPPHDLHHAVWSNVPGGIRRPRRILARCKEARAGEKELMSGGRFRR
jgi:hypothetical protein